MPIKRPWAAPRVKRNHGGEVEGPDAGNADGNAVVVAIYGTADVLIRIVNEKNDVAEGKFEHLDAPAEIAAKLGESQ